MVSLCKAITKGVERSPDFQTSKTFGAPGSDLLEHRERMKRDKKGKREKCRESERQKN